MQINVMKIVSLVGFAAALFIALMGLSEKDCMTSAFGVLMMAVELVSFMKV